MSPEHWGRVLATAADSEMPDLLMMLADEDFLNEEEAAWLRHVAADEKRGSRRLCPRPKKISIYWHNEWIEGRYDDLERSRSVPAWLLDRMGRCEEEGGVDARGIYTRYYATVEEAYLDLLLAMSRK